MTEQYCKKCKKVTPHKTISMGKLPENAGNGEFECNMCGTRMFTIQGFDSDLM